MMKKKIKNKLSKPAMKWQVGEFAHSQQLELHLPYPFLLLCKITNVTPRQLLIDFMDNLAHSSWKSKGRDEAKKSLVNYFLVHGYGQPYHHLEEIKTMFKEMDAVGKLFPGNDPNMVSVYAKWRDKHQKYWFKKWFNKNKR